MKSVLILGAGLMQKPAILSARKLGLFCAVVDADKNAVSVPLADEFCQIDLKDREGILSYAQELKSKKNLCGIFTAGTDFSASVSYAAEKLSLPCHSFESSLNASIKDRMRYCFEQNGVSSPRYKALSSSDFSENRILEVCNELGFPCVVKPVDNMGARGCRMIRTADEAFFSATEAASNSRSGTIIIEEYMQGPEFSIDALVYNGTVTITGFADRHIFFPPYFIETGHTMPSAIEESKKLELISCFAKGIASIGLSCGAAKADIKYTKNGPCIGEIAARLSGGYMSGWTFPYASGFDLTKNALMIAAGLTPTELLSKRRELPLQNSTFKLYEVPCVRVSAERAWISVPGTVKDIFTLNSAQKKLGVRDVLPRSVKIGDVVDFPRNNVQKCGNIISCKKNRKNAIKIAENAASSVIIRLKANNPQTEAFLSGIQSQKEKGFPPAAFAFKDDFLSLSLSDDSLIPAKKSTVQFAKTVPALQKVLKSPAKSFEYRTFLQTLKAFDKICKNHNAVPAKRFFLAVIQGGLQGALYVSDSATNSEN